LINLLEHEDHSVREKAVLAVGEIGDISCVFPLAQRFKDEYLDIRVAANSAITKMGTQVVVPLIEVLKDQNRIVREGAVQALEKIQDTRAIYPLIEALRDTNWKRISDALRSIGPASFEPLIEALENEDTRIRIGAITILSEMKNPAAIEHLAKLTKDKDSTVRQYVKSAIHRVKRDTELKKQTSSKPTNSH
jgi:HEAT repeat protein